MTRETVVLVLVLVLAAVASAQTTESRVADALRVEWKRVDDPPRVVGHVHNGSPYRIGLVRLRLTTRAGAGQPTEEMLAWVHGNVPARGRWPFSVRIGQPREIVGVSIESFRLVALEAPAESP
jgi:hypothetical protein